MNDTIELLATTRIQHGPHNDRIYVLGFSCEDYPEIIGMLETLRATHSYSKICAKVPAHCLPGFLQAGYRIEAYIPDYYGNHNDALFLAGFFTQERAKINLRELDPLAGLFMKEKGVPGISPGTGIRIDKAGEYEAEEMAQLYRKVFKSYPFPIVDPDYLRETMRTHIVYFTLRKGNRLTGLASCEIDKENRNVEMTDFAVDPDFRGNRFGALLLAEMESEMKKAGMRTSFTIARVRSRGINRIFHNAGYSYSGTLVNNTNIAGALESMNVWYKKLYNRIQP